MTANAKLRVAIKVAPRLPPVAKKALMIGGVTQGGEM